MKKGLFIRKPMKAEFIEVDEEHHGLKRHLGPVQLTSIGIGAIIGAGIFVITGQAAAQYAGPAIVLSFIITAIVCMFAGLCYAELSALIPISGGAYSYAYVAMGEFTAWLVGWSITAQYICSISTVAVGWSGYFTSFLKDWGIMIPDAVTKAPFLFDPEAGWRLSGAFLNVPAVVLVAMIGALVAIGIKAAANFNNVLVVIKLATVLIIIIVGIPYIHTENWVPFIPDNTGVFGEFGWSGILRASGLVFFAYVGFDVVATLAQDSINPQKDLPKGILGSLAISTVAYILISLVLTGLVSYMLLNVPDPMAAAMNALGPKWFWIGFIVKVAILAGLASVALIQLLGQTRIFFAVSKDGLLPHRFSVINKKTRTPIFSSVLTALIAMTIAGVFSVDILGQLVSMSTLFLFTIVCLGVLILRYRHPEFNRPFKVPFVPYLPALGIFFCLAQMCFMPLVTWIQLIGWFILGLVIYFTYGIRHSKIRNAHRV